MLAQVLLAELVSLADDQAGLSAQIALSPFGVLVAPRLGLLHLVYKADYSIRSQ